MAEAPKWLERYRAGQRNQVWHELRQLGSAVRQPGLAEEAQLVCDEMARRARRNIEVIVERLARDGYRFHSNNDEQEPVTPWIPATAAAGEMTAWLEQRFGPIPMTLLSWARIVGDVWLVGTHPRWHVSASADPLVIQLEGTHYPNESIRDHFAETHQGWRDRNTRRPGASPFVLPLSPDQYHKDNVSGGSPYGMIVPDACADGMFAGPATMPFVSYLNWAFANGGFPWPTGSNAQWQVRHDLVKDLLTL